MFEGRPILCLIGLALLALPVRASARDDFISIYLTPQNEQKMLLMAEDVPVSEIKVYSHTGGTFLPLFELFSLLEIPYQFDATQKIITWREPDDSSDVILEISASRYWKNNRQRSLFRNQLLAFDKEYYIDSNLLRRLLNIAVTSDVAASKLKLNNVPTWNTATAARALSPPVSSDPEQKSTPVQLHSNTEQAVKAPTYSNPPMEPPGPASQPIVELPLQPGEDFSITPSQQYDPAETRVMPVIERVLDKNGQPIGEPEPLPPPELPSEIANTDSKGHEIPVQSEPKVDEALPEGEGLTLLQPVIKGFKPIDIYLESYFERGDIFLPLDTLFEVLEFPIRVDNANYSAKGTFLNSNNEFSLIGGKGQPASVRVGEQEFTLTQSDYFQRDDVLLVARKAIEKWFDLTLRYEEKKSQLRISSQTPLPMVEREQRRRRWLQMAAADKSKPKEENLPLLENEYSAAEIPFVDVNLDSSYASTQSEKTFRNSYNIISAGDLGYLSTESYIAGDINNKPLSNLRIRAGRASEEGGLLGPLDAASFSLGDIYSSTVPLVTGSGIQRGVSVTNRPGGYNPEFDVKTFIGDATPGYEVELYRNNVLLEFQIVDANGRYEFRDVPILFGTNSFRLVFYGPQGEIEEKVEVVYGGMTQAKRGETTYNFSLGEKSTTLFGIEELDSIRDPIGIRGIAQVEHGFTEDFSAGIGAVQTRLQNGDHQYLTSSSTLGFGSWLTQLNTAYDLNGGWSTEASALTTIDDISVRMSQQFLSNFVSERETNPLDNLHTAISDLDLNGQFFLPWIEDFYMGLQATREEFENSEALNSLTHRVSKNLFGVSFTNALQYQFGAIDQTLGSLAAQGRFNDMLIRMVADYRLQNKTELRAVSMSEQHRINEDLLSRTAITYDFEQDGQTRLSQALGWQFEDYILSLQGDVTNEGEYYAGVNLSFGFGVDPYTNEFHTTSRGMASGGAISSRVFVDDNYNNTYDEGEEVLEDADLEINGRRTKADDEGLFFASSIQPYQTNKVTVNLESIKEPLLIPSIEGYKVLTRPGDIVKVDIPLVSSSQIDGFVLMQHAQGEEEGLQDIPVRLMDKKGQVVKETMTEDDGFFVFENLLQGTYQLQVPQVILKALKALQSNIATVEVSRVSDFYSDQNIILKTTEPPFMEEGREKKTKEAPKERSESFIQPISGLLFKY